MTNVSWGTDGKISLPKPLESTHVEMADMEGFCFTPDGLRANLTTAERDDLITQGYGPQGASLDGGP